MNFAFLVIRESVWAVIDGGRRNLSEKSFAIRMLALFCHWIAVATSPSGWLINGTSLLSEAVVGGGFLRSSLVMLAPNVVESS